MSKEPTLDDVPRVVESDNHLKVGASPTLPTEIDTTEISAVISKTAKDTQLEIAKLQRQLATLENDDEVIRSMEFLENERDAQMALDNEFLKLENILIELRNEIIKAMQKPKLLGIWKRNKTKVAYKILEKINLPKIASTILKTANQIISKYGVSKSIDIHIENKTNNESLSKSYKRLTFICSFISDTFDYDYSNFDYTKRKIDECIELMHKY
ncbi:MAG: hypothetical protein WC070_03925 [Candidatus Magasanikbacteria bacterium]